MDLLSSRLAALLDSRLVPGLDSHLAALAVFSLFTSVAMGTLAENTPRDRAISSAKVFVGFLVATVIGAWIMRFIN